MCPRVLIIDDDPTNLDLLALLLRAVGHEPIPALSGEEALLVAAKSDPDLILCDVHMPGIDGFEVVRRCRLDRRLDRTPIVAVTALAMVGDRERVLQAGFDGYLSKPIDPETFIAALNRYVPGRFSTSLPPRAEAHSSPKTPPLRRDGYVLVIDDSADGLMLMKHLLESLGLEVVTADRVAGGVAAAAARIPVLVVCDVHLPAKDGFDAIVELRALPGFDQTPFVFLSSTATVTDQRRGLSLGAHKFLTRPIEPEVLLRELAPYLEKSP